MNAIGQATCVLLSFAAVSMGCQKTNVMNSRPTATRSVPGPTDPDAPTEFSVTDSGLKYRILRKSDIRGPLANEYVRVHYRGWLDDGKEFDSSYNGGEPAVFGVGDVIPGWTEGLQLVGQGGMIELEIPGKLGYGSDGTPEGPIPPNATLHFIVELIEIL